MKKGGLVFSTNRHFELEKEDSENNVCKSQFILSVCFEKKGRAGKGVTIIKGFEGKKQTLNLLSKKIKQSLGLGGSIKNNDIIIQGRVQDKIITLLKTDGYRTKKVGG
tara:strand:+ start:384 stop:707 length:324 start_codon:yes stop_codon:yes gene_type:complete